MLFASESSLHAVDLEASLATMSPCLRHDNFALALPLPSAPHAPVEVTASGMLTRPPENSSLGCGDGLEVPRKVGGPGRRPRTWLQLSRKLSASGWLTAVGSGASADRTHAGRAGSTLGSRAPLRLGVSSAFSDLQVESKRRSKQCPAPAQSGVGSKEAVLAKAVLVVLQPPGGGQKGRQARPLSLPGRLKGCFCGGVEETGSGCLDLDDVARSLAMLKLVSVLFYLDPCFCQVGAVVCEPTRGVSTALFVLCQCLCHSCARVMRHSMRMIGVHAADEDGASN
jgi:hypothetical protein